ncbi:hypothetical protein UlMin_021138 [Ulmus minor]
MELYKSWYVILVISLSISSFVVQVSYGFDIESLETFLHDQANRSLLKPQTGTLYNIPLPSNFTGMELSVVRLRTGSFRSRGANFSSFYIPPQLKPNPYMKRLAIVYENLGNWSSLYYKVPNYSLVAPVVGFSIYDSPNSSVIGSKKLNFSIKGDPISIWFNKIELEGKNETPKCVKFGDNGSFKLKNMTKTNGCVTKGQGHFSIVVPSQPTSPPMKKKGILLIWWLIGFCGGFIGVVSLVLAMTAMFKIVKKKKLEAMEKQSEKEVPFDSIWIGRSKMPTASMVRTQPALEQEYAP